MTDKQNLPWQLEELRDKFAMAALPIAWKAKEDGYYEGDDEDVAACAYQMADAMLKARG